MAAQGSTFHGPLSIKEGGLKLFDAAGRKSSEELLVRVEIPASVLIATPANSVIATLVPAPGPNKFFELLGANLFYRHGGVNFTSNTGSIRIQNLNGASVFSVNVDGFMDQATSQLRTLLPAAANFSPVEKDRKSVV